MQPVTDELLLGVAGVCATIIGLFLVGIVFFVEMVVGHPGGPLGGVLHSYMRAGTRIVIAVFATALMLSIALVAFDLAWATVVYIALSLILVVLNVDTAIRIGPVTRAIGSKTLLINEIIGSAGVAAIVTLPWILGGTRPSREDLTLAALISFATAFVSVAATALTVFDMAQLAQQATDQKERLAAAPPRVTDMHDGPAGPQVTMASGASAIDVRDATRVLYVAGTVGLDPSHAPRAAVPDQLGLIWSNLQRLLAGSDMAVGNVVGVTNYIRHAGDADAVAAARLAVLGNRPISSRTVVTPTLADDWLVEIDLIAVA
jgi:2-iminobutanoate/2-iminopropanoate deaminase